MDLTKILQGRKTYLAAFGLAGLAFFQYSTGDLAGAVQSALGALTAFGLRSAIAQAITPPPPPEQPAP